MGPDAQAHKQLTGVRKKTEEQQLEIAKSEYFGGMYFHPSVGPYMPGQNIKAAIVEGAKLNKLGKSVQRSLLIMDDMLPLEYPGPRTREELWEKPEFIDVRSVVVQRNRLMRYRPKFDKWSVELTILYNPDGIERDQLIMALEKAGQLIGLCDYRPACGGPFGRFHVEILD